MKHAIFLLAAASVFGADVALTLAIGNRTSKVQADGQSVEASSTTSVMITPGGDFANVGVAAIGWEIPVAFGGPARALIAGGRINTEKIDFMLVPGARIRLVPTRRFSPWASVGLGVGRFNRATVTTVGGALRAVTESAMAVSVGVGLDVKLGGPAFLRAEGRDFNYKSVDTLRRNSFQFLAGIGLRF